MVAREPWPGTVLLSGGRLGDVLHNSVASSGESRCQYSFLVQQTTNRSGVGQHRQSLCRVCVRVCCGHMSGNHVGGNHVRISPLTFSLIFRLAMVSPGASVSIVMGPPIAAWKLTRSGAGEVNVWETAPDTMDCVGARGDAVYGPADGGRVAAGAANSGGPLADAAAREGDGEDTGTPMLAGGVIRTEETAEEREVTLAGSAAGTAPAAAPVTRIK